MDNNWWRTYEGLGGTQALFKNKHFKPAGGYKPLVLKSAGIRDVKLGHCYKFPRAGGNI